MEVLHELVRTVSRTFYEDKFSIFLDFLLSERMYKSITDRMRVVLKEVNRTAAKLREDKLLKSEARQEMRPSDMKMINKTYYYIDFKLFVDVVKYKMYMMKKSIEDQMKNEAENKGYKCPQCKKNYSALELQSLMNPQSMLFECEVCSAEIEEHIEDPAKVKATQETLSQLMEQTAPLLRLLKKTDSITVPQFDPVEHLKRKQAFDAMTKANEDASSAAGSQVYDGISNPSGSSVNIQIQIEDSDKPATVHTMPSWHTHSTVTGEQILPGDSTTSLEPHGTVSSFTIDMTATTETESLQQYYEELQSNTSLPAKRTSEAIDETEEKVDESEKSATLQTGVLVTVKGAQKPLEEVTDEDKSLMTPEEYSQYYEAYMESL